MPIINVVGPRIINSIFLVVVAAAISIPLALALAIVGATRPGSKADTVIAVLKLLAITKGSAVVPGMLLLMAETTVADVLSESRMFALASCATRLHFT